MTPAIEAGACLLAALTGEVRAEALGWQETLHATLFHREGCGEVRLVLPPGVALTGRSGRTLGADRPSHPLDEARWSPPRPRSDGARVVTLALADLAPGDRVELRLERTWTTPADYRWEPGRDGARYADLRLPRATTHTHAGLHHDGQVVWARPPAEDAWLVVHHPWAPREPAVAPPSALRGLAPEDARARLDRLVLLPRAVDGRVPVVGDAALARGAVDDRGWARTLLALLDGGPVPAELGRWTPAAPFPPAPGALEVVVLRGPDGATVAHHPDLPVPAGVIVAEGGPVAVSGHDGAPPVWITGATPLAGPAPRWEVEVELALPAEQPLAGLGPRGRGARTVRWTATWEDAEAPRLVALPVPPDVEVSGDVVPDDGVAWLLAPPGRATAELAWTGPLPDAWGALPWPADQARGQVVLVGRDGARRDVGELVFDDGATWRLARIGDRPILADRQALIRELDARVGAASYPEPATSRRDRGGLAGAELAERLVELLDARVLAADLPGATPLFPRPLARARRQGLVTPLEAAAILALYLRQGHLDAEWALARPASAAPWSGVAPVGFDAALVRVTVDGEERWIDPACGACATWEIRPELVGGDVLGPGAPARLAPPALAPIDGDDAPPRALTAHAARTTREDEPDGTTWTLAGVDALALRRHLMALPPDARRPALATLLGVPADALEVEGVAERGAVITVRSSAVPERDPLDPDLVRALGTSWGPAVRRWIRPGPPGEDELACEGPGWTLRATLRDGTWTEVLVLPTAGPVDPAWPACHARVLDATAPQAPLTTP